jgi:hypothetical protein
MPPTDRRKLRAELAAIRNAAKAAARNTGRRSGNAPSRKAARNQAYSRPLRQGVGAITNKPFGSVGGSAMRALDANHPSHLSLPRAVGPYTVVRTTQLINTKSFVNFFGPFAADTATQNSGTAWTPICCMRDVDASLPINDPLNCEFLPFLNLDPANGWDGCTLTPSAFTVQIMNPTNLQGANGIARVGRLRFIPDILNDTRTWTAFAEQCSAFNFPRLCSGGKLALRGVKTDAVPFDMSELSNFSRLRPFTGPITVTYDQSSSIEPAGFAPIMVLMDDAMSLAGGLEVLITCEWRVRFDPSNPAQGTHRRYPVASDSTWNSVLAKMESCGHGVVDIAEDIAEMGAVAGAVGLML